MHTLVGEIEHVPEVQIREEGEVFDERRGEGLLVAHLVTKMNYYATYHVWCVFYYSGDLHSRINPQVSLCWWRTTYCARRGGVASSRAVTLLPFLATPS